MDDPKERLIISTGSASFDRYAEGASREHLYSVHWKSADATTLDQKRSFVKLKDVTGEFFKTDPKTKKETVSSTIQSDSGVLDQSTGKISLTGEVQVHNFQTKPSQTILCDKMTYEESDRIIKATGDVRMVGDLLSIGNYSELWASPDLKVVSVPELFAVKDPLAAVSNDIGVQVRHNQQGSPSSVSNNAIPGQPILLHRLDTRTQNPRGQNSR